MARKIVYKSSIKHDLKNLDRNRAGELIQKIKEKLESDPNSGEPLHGEFNGLYRLRIGEYRVIYTKINDTILVLRIRYRSKVYE